MTLLPGHADDGAYTVAIDTWSIGCCYAEMLGMLVSSLACGWVGGGWACGAANCRRFAPLSLVLVGRRTRATPSAGMTAAPCSRAAAATPCPRTAAAAPPRTSRARRRRTSCRCATRRRGSPRAGGGGGARIAATNSTRGRWYAMPLRNETASRPVAGAAALCLGTLPLVHRHLPWSHARQRLRGSSLPRRPAAIPPPSLCVRRTAIANALPPPVAR
jgi:hypothetical protein